MGGGSNQVFCLFLHSVSVVYNSDWFLYVEPSLNCRDKSHLVMVSVLRVSNHPNDRWYLLVVLICISLND